jgi:hypothetical protein
VSGGRDRSVRVWQLPPLNMKKPSKGHESDPWLLGRCLGVIDGHENNGVYSVCCLNNGNVVVSSEDHCIQLWSFSFLSSSIPTSPDRGKFSPASLSSPASRSASTSSASTPALKGSLIHEALYNLDAAEQSSSERWHSVDSLAHSSCIVDNELQKGSLLVAAEGFINSAEMDPVKALEEETL